MSIKTVEIFFHLWYSRIRKFFGSILLVMALEDEYSVEIPSEDLEKLVTVGDVMEYLKEKGVE